MDENPYKAPGDSSGGHPPTLEELIEREYTKDTIRLLISAVLGFFVLAGLVMAGEWLLEYLGVVQ